MNTATRRVLTKQDFSPEEERVYREFLREWTDTTEPIAESLEAAVRSGQVDLSSLSAIRATVSGELGRYTGDIETVFTEQAKDAAVAGRTLAARRHQLDINFDQLPERTIAELESWTTTASEEVAGTLEDEITNYLRGAREEGLDIETVADEFQSEFVEGRLQDSKAEQLARDVTVQPSNAGQHSAHVDSGAIAERWVTNIDGRERDTHAEADGQVVAVEGTFLVGGYEAEYPGDPTLPVEEFTQCRCTAVPVFADELTTSQIEAIEAGERIYA